MKYLVFSIRPSLNHQIYIPNMAVLFIMLILCTWRWMIMKRITGTVVSLTALSKMYEPFMSSSSLKEKLLPAMVKFTESNDVCSCPKQGYIWRNYRRNWVLHFSLYTNIIGETSGSHSDKYENACLVGCYIMRCCKIPTDDSRAVSSSESSVSIHQTTIISLKKTSIFIATKYLPPK